MARGQRFDVRMLESMIQALEQYGDDAGQAFLARTLGVDRSTVRKHRPDALRILQDRRAKAPTAEDLRAVDMAMVAQAKKGNVSAARLVFLRMGQGMADDVPLPNEAELEDALVLVRGMKMVSQKQE